MNSSNEKRTYFTNEHDRFLMHLLRTIEDFQEKWLWNQVTRLFNEQFPSSKKTKKQIHVHFQNCLQKDLKNGEFSKDEIILFHIFKQEKHFTFSNIAKEMSRTLQSVKNYYYRKCVRTNQINVVDNIEKNHIKNDFPFWGIDFEDF
jgi:hypothetical protein